MREPALGLKTSLLHDGSLLDRIRGNLLSLWRLSWVPMPATHSPIHLLDERLFRRAPGAQVGSTALHLLLCIALLWSVAQPTSEVANVRAPRDDGRSLPPIPQWLVTANIGSLGKKGDSGGQDQLPPTAGQLAPMSRSAFVSPHISDARPHPLAVSVTIANPDAPEIVRNDQEIGLPWMSDKNHSEGSGENGLGKGKGHGMGVGLGDGSGVGSEPGVYAPTASQVICRVCPDPLYSEEARKAKLQGLVVLSVLVGIDGRVKDVRVIRGLGMGLDENAVAAVRGWQLVPAKDAAQQPATSWIKVETMFRLF